MTGGRSDRLATELWDPADLAAPGTAGFATHALLHAGDGLVALPTASRRSAAESMLRWTDGTTHAQTAVRLLGWAALRSGIVAPLLRDRVGVRTGSAGSGEPSLHEFLAAAVGAPKVHLTCGFGTVRPNRKPIVRIHATDGRTLGFAKIGWNPLTEALVATEADLLSSSAVRDLRRIRVPEVLFRGRWRDHLVSVTAPVLGPLVVRRPPVPGLAVHEELAAMTPGPTEPLGRSSYRRSIATRAAGLAPQERDAVAAAEAVLDERWGDRPLRFGRWHGDWAPWNLRTVGNRLIVWDWERSAPGVPVGFDAVHLEFHRRLAAGASAPSSDTLTVAAAAAAPVVTALGQPDVDPVVLLYAIEMQLRFGAADAVAWLPGLVHGTTERVRRG